MKFSFAFEKLLDHRKMLEDLARKDYLLAASNVATAEGELRQMYDDIRESRNRAGELGRKGGAQGPALSQIDEFIRGQNIRIQRQREKIRELMAEAERKQLALVEAAREHKTLQKLKERRLADFKRALKKGDLKIIDEIVTTRFKREAV